MKKFIYGIFKFVQGPFVAPLDQHLRILAYHTVPDSLAFEKQLNFLNLNYSIISIEQLEAHLLKDTKLPKRPVLITFDDGDISVFEKGFPLLKKFGLPAVVFVITELIDSDKMFWCRWVEKSMQKEGKSYTEARRKVNYLKTISESERRKYLKTLPAEKGPQLTHRDLSSMAQENIFIGNHTHTHPMVNNCTNEQLNGELRKSKEKFRSWNLEKGYSIFAYPNGNWETRTEAILKDEGIKMAFLFDHKINDRKINPLRISRLRVNSDSPLSEFKVKVSGFHSMVMFLKARGKKNKK